MDALRVKPMLDGRAYARKKIHSEVIIKMLDRRAQSRAQHFMIEGSMFFSNEIFHKNDLDLHGLSVCRNAVRAVITKNNQILLVYSKTNDEYKFPGGGVKENETPEMALLREIDEEIGGTIVEVKGKIGTVIEYNTSQEETIDYFKMTSDYYEVVIEEHLHDQSLDDYEKELAFIPKWTTIKEALEVNRKTMECSDKKTKWIQRETYVLNELLKYKKCKVSN